MKPHDHPQPLTSAAELRSHLNTSDHSVAGTDTRLLSATLEWMQAQHDAEHRKAEVLEKFPAPAEDEAETVVLDVPPEARFTVPQGLEAVPDSALPPFWDPPDDWDRPAPGKDSPPAAEPAGYDEATVTELRDRVARLHSEDTGPAVPGFREHLVSAGLEPYGSRQAVRQGLAPVPEADRAEGERLLAAFRTAYREFDAFRRRMLDAVPSPEAEVLRRADAVVAKHYHPSRLGYVASGDELEAMQTTRAVLQRLARLLEEVSHG